MTKMTAEAAHRLLSEDAGRAHEACKEAEESLLVALNGSPHADIAGAMERVLHARAYSTLWNELFGHVGDNPVAALAAFRVEVTNRLTRPGSLNLTSSNPVRNAQVQAEVEELQRFLGETAWYPTEGDSEVV